MDTPSLVNFIDRAWLTLEPGTPYQHNWHIDCIAEHLQAVTSGQIRRLIINQPPRSLKSTLVSICWPVWSWITDPESRWMFASYAQSLSTFHSLQRRLLIQSDWYQDAWPHVQLARDQNQKMEFNNTRQGMMIATSVGGTSIGKGGDVLVFDDPLSPTEAASEAARLNANDWIRQGFLTRLNDPKTGRIVGVMQRLHEEDTTGMLLAMGEWTHLCLPAEAEERLVVHFPVSGRELVRESGDILFPGREGVEELARKRIELGSYAYAGQYQQRPSPAEGGLLKRAWWRFWYQGSTPAPAPVTVRLVDGTAHECAQIALPDPRYNRDTPLHERLQSWDMAFKETETSDFVVGQYWARRGADKFLLDQVRGRWDFPATLQVVRDCSARWLLASAILIEEAANGAAVVASLRHDIAGIIPIKPSGGKEARVNACAPAIEAGNVYLPHPLMPGFGWVQAFIDECAAFPNAAHDDQVDAMSQALARLLRANAYSAPPPARPPTAAQRVARDIESIGGPKRPPPISTGW